MARTRKAASPDHTDALPDNSDASVHPYWESVEKLAPLAKGRCRCTSVEHDREEPGCEASPGGDGAPL